MDPEIRPRALRHDDHTEGHGLGNHSSTRQPPRSDQGCDVREVTDAVAPGVETTGLLRERQDAFADAYRRWAATCSDSVVAGDSHARNVGPTAEGS